MDIDQTGASKTPKNMGSLTSGSGSQISKPSEITLTPDKQYTAEVIQKVPAAKIDQQAIKLSSTPSQTAVSAPDPKAGDHYIIRLNGQLIEVKSQTTLVQGEKLQLKPTIGEKGLLELITITSKNTQNNNLNTDKNTQNQSAIIKQLSQLLSQQVSLSKGFDILNKVAQLNLPETSQAKTTQQLSQLSQTNSNIQNTEKPQNTNPPQQSATNYSSVKLGNQAAVMPDFMIKQVQQLINSLSKSSEFQLTANGTATSNAKHDTHLATSVLKLLQNSGLFTESKLFKQSTAQDLSSILQNLTGAGKTSAATPNTATGTTTNPQPATNPPAPGVNGSAAQTGSNSVTTTTQALSSSALNINIANATNNTTHSKISENLYQTHQINQNHGAHGQSKTGENITPATSLETDLKVRLINMLTAATSNTKMDHESLQTPLPFNDELLEVQPFNFPKMENEATAKAKARLADREFSLGQLLKIAAAMLNRIQFNQLNSLLQTQSSEAGQTQSWFYELPIVNNQNTINVFSLRVDKRENDQEKQAETEKEAKEIQWKLGMSFNIEELGPMYIQVVLTPPSVSSSIWAERDSTFDLVSAESQHLKSKLQELGLDVGAIVCQQGLPEITKTRINQSLVDVQA